MQDHRTAAAVLVADDEVSLQEAVVDALQRKGYQAFGAANGADAIRLARRVQPRVSVLDLNMPDMTGVDVLVTMKAEGLWTPTIFITAEPNEDLRVRAVSLGAIAVIDKPFSLEVILKWVLTGLASSVGRQR